jgi:hypothetical protein
VVSHPAVAPRQTPSEHAWSLTVWPSRQVHVYGGQSAKLAHAEPLDPLVPDEPLEPLVRGLSMSAVPDQVLPNPMQAPGQADWGVWHTRSTQRCALTSE